MKGELLFHVEKPGEVFFCAGIITDWWTESDGWQVHYHDLIRNRRRSVWVNRNPADNEFVYVLDSSGDLTLLNELHDD